MRLLLALAILVLSPTLAFAHSDAGQAAGFFHGFAHPIGGLDHVLAMVAVGLLASVIGGKAVWLVPASFLGMMIVGFALGNAQVAIPFVELGIAVSSIVIGSAAVLGRPLPTAGAMALVGVFAIFHGHAHGAEMPTDASGVTYAAGFLVATALLNLSGIVATLGSIQLLGRHGRMMVRLGGSALAFAGVGILAGWL